MKKIGLIVTIIVATVFSLRAVAQPHQTNPNYIPLTQFNSKIVYPLNPYLRPTILGSTNYSVFLPFIINLHLPYTSTHAIRIINYGKPSTGRVTGKVVTTHPQLYKSSVNGGISHKAIRTTIKPIKRIGIRNMPHKMVSSQALIGR